VRCVALVNDVLDRMLLALIEEKLEEPRQAEKMTEKKVTDWIKT